MPIYLKQSTASQEIPLGYFVDSTDGNTEETGLTIANTDIKLWKNGATTLANKNSGGGTHISNGIYYAVLDATDTNTLGPMVIFCHISGALPVRVECVVLAANIYDSMIAGTDLFDVNVTQISGSAVSTSSAQLGVNVVNAGGTAWGSGAITAGSIATNAITSTKIAADAIGASELAADAVTEIATGVWANATRTLSAATNITSTGGTITVSTGAVTVGTNNDKTGYSLTQTFPTNFADLAITATTGRVDVASIEGADATDQINAACDTAVSDQLTAYDAATGTDVTNAAANVSVDEIQATALADLFNTDSGTTYGSAVSGSVVKEIADNAGGSSLTVADIADGVWRELLADHDSVSGSAAEGLSGASAPSAADVADAVWDEATSGHVSAGTFGKLAADVLADTNELQTDDIPGLIATAQADLDTITGTDGVTLATAQGNYAPAKASDIPTSDITAILADTNELQTNQGDWATATGFSTLDAAGVRTAIGLASANLDTQLAALPTAAENADAVWEEAITDHSGTSGSTAEALNAAGASGDPWTTALPGSYTSGQAGYIVGTFIDTALSDLATSTALSTVDSNVDAIKAKTDNLTFTVSNQVDANTKSMNDATVNGNGTSGDLWRGA